MVERVKFVELKNITTELHFFDQILEEKPEKSKYAKPSKPVSSIEINRKDVNDLETAMGLNQCEILAYLHTAVKHMHDNPAVIAKLKELFVIVRLTEAENKNITKAHKATNMYESLMVEYERLTKEEEESYKARKEKFNQKISSIHVSVNQKLDDLMDHAIECYGKRRSSVWGELIIESLMMDETLKGADLDARVAEFKAADLNVKRHIVHRVFNLHEIWYRNNANAMIIRTIEKNKDSSKLKSLFSRFGVDLNIAAFEHIFQSNEKEQVEKLSTLIKEELKAKHERQEDGFDY